MKIYLIAVGNKMPEFVNMGFKEYSKRFPKDVSLELIEIPAGKRGKNADIERITNHEGELMIQAIPKGAMVITMDIPGKMYNNEDLAYYCKNLAEKSLSLSPLTMPHPIVRIVIAESLYRAWSITENHPYHRE